MAKRVARQSKEQKLLEIWWARVAAGVILLAISYGLISWAIDSGSLWQYALGIILAYWAVAHLIRGVMHAFSR